MKILAVCAHGLGSSFLMEMNIKKALVKLGIEAEVGHSDLSLSADLSGSSSRVLVLLSKEKGVKDKAFLLSPLSLDVVVPVYERAIVNVSTWV